MVKLTLSNVGSLIDATTAGGTINSNFTAIETAWDNNLSRDGTTPNQMQSNLDMNSNHILNLPTPTGNYDPIRLIDVSTINAGGITVSPLPAGGTTNQVLEKNSSTNYDVSWKNIVGIPAGGSASQVLEKNSSSDYDTSWATSVSLPSGGSTGQVLTKRSSTNFDVDWESIAGNGFDPRAYGALGDGTTDDSNAITNCITAAKAAHGTMVLTDGNYYHTSTLNWAWNNFKVIALGANVIFTHGGTGVAHQFSGIANYPGSQGCVSGIFGGPNRIFLRGNASTTNLVLVDNWHFGDMKISGKNASNAIFKAQDTGLPQVNSSAVESTFDIQISANTDGAYTTVPTYGVYADKLASSTFNKLIVEGVGNVSLGSPAVVLNSCVATAFNGGTVESNLAGGIKITGGVLGHRNTFSNMDVEANGTQPDWNIAGNNNTFINCAGAGTTAGNIISGDWNVFTGGQYQSVVLTSAAGGNTFDGSQFLVAFTDSGTNNSVINPDGIALALDNAPTILGNKTINTANNTAIKFNSKSATDLSGTGSILATTVGPSLTNPIISGASPAVAGAVGYNAGLLNWYDGAALRSAVASDATQSLTNKTISGSSNTITNVSLTTGVTGTLPRANGGGATSVAAEQAALFQGVLVATATGVNFNSANTDTAIPISLPAGYTRFSVFRLTISHASASLSTSTVGLFTTTGGGGAGLVATQANTVTSSADITTNNYMSVNGASASCVVSALPTPNTIYFRVSTAQGSAATGDVTVYYFPLP